MRNGRKAQAEVTEVRLVVCVLCLSSPCESPLACTALAVELDVPLAKEALVYIGLQGSFTSCFLCLSSSDGA